MEKSVLGKPYRNKYTPIYTSNTVSQEIISQSAHKVIYRLIDVKDNKTTDVYEYHGINTDTALK